MTSANPSWLAKIHASCTPGSLATFERVWEGVMLVVGMTGACLCLGCGAVRRIRTAPTQLNIRSKRTPPTSTGLQAIASEDTDEKRRRLAVGTQLSLGTLWVGKSLYAEGRSSPVKRKSGAQRSALLGAAPSKPVRPPRRSRTRALGPTNSLADEAACRRRGRPARRLRSRGSRRHPRRRRLGYALPRPN